MTVRVGNRLVLVWGENVWVTILLCAKTGQYRVLPPDGQEFVVAADSDDQCLDKIVKELRRRIPRAP